MDRDWLIISIGVTVWYIFNVIMIIIGAWASGF